jgi:hypothetical protein
MAPPTPEVGARVKAFRWGRHRAEWALGVVVDVSPGPRGDWVKVVWDDGTHDAEWVSAETTQVQPEEKA